MKKRHRTIRKPWRDWHDIAERERQRQARLSAVRSQPIVYSPPVAALLELGHQAGMDYRERCGVGMDHVPELIHLAVSGASDEGLSSDYAADHAWQALGQLQTEAAIPTLIDLLQDLDIIGLETVIPETFAQLGPQAVPALAQVLEDYDCMELASYTAVECLKHIGCTRPMMREACLKALGGQLRNYRRRHEEFNGMVIAAMLELKPTSYRTLIERAFKSGAVDKMEVSWEEIDRFFNPRAYYWQDDRIALTGPYDHPTPASLPLIERPAVKKSLPVEPEPLIPYDLPFNLTRDDLDLREPEIYSPHPSRRPAQSPVHDYGDYQGRVRRLLSLGEAAACQEPWLDYLALRFTGEDVPELIRMAADRRFQDEADETIEFWAVAHARRALAQLQAVEAIPPLVELFHDWRDEITTQDLPTILALLGPASIPLLEPMLPAFAEAERFTAVYVTETLREMAQRHPESRDECIRILMRQLEQFAHQEHDTTLFLIHALLRLRAVEAGPLLQKILKHTEYIDDELTGDWFHVQYLLGFISQEEADQQRLDHWRKQDQKRNRYVFDDLGLDISPLDMGHDFTRSGDVDRAWVKMRAARWAYHVSQQWYYGPPVYIAIGTMDRTPEAEMVGIAMLDQAGEILLDRLIQITRSIDPDLTLEHGIGQTDVQGQPTFLDIYPEMQAALGKRRAVFYDDTARTLLDDLCTRHQVEHVAQYGVHRMDAEYAYFWGSLNDAADACVCQRLHHTAAQQGILIEQGLAGQCRMMRQIVLKMAQWLVDTAEPEEEWYGSASDFGTTLFPGLPPFYWSR